MTNSISNNYSQFEILKTIRNILTMATSVYFLFRLLRRNLLKIMIKSHILLEILYSGYTLYYQLRGVSIPNFTIDFYIPSWVITGWNLLFAEPSNYSSETLQEVQTIIHVEFV